MVILHADSENGDHVFTIRPNCSLSWSGTKAAFAVLATALLLVTLYFTVRGAWLVAPFTGLEIVILGVGLYLSARRGATREVVRIEHDIVVISRGIRRLQEAARFQRSWARVRLVRDPRDWYPSRLLIGSHGRSIEIGSDLIEEERSDLADQLRQQLSAQPPTWCVPANDCLGDLDTLRQQA